MQYKVAALRQSRGILFLHLGEILLQKGYEFALLSIFLPCHPVFEYLFGKISHHF